MNETLDLYGDEIKVAAGDGKTRSLMQRLHEAAERSAHRSAVSECTKKINHYMKDYLCCRVKWVSISDGDDLDEAIDILVRLRDLEATLSRLYFRRGSANLALGNVKKALSDLDEAARLE